MSRRTDPLFEEYLLETRQLLEKTELMLIRCEKMKSMDQETINEIFRAMHTIKGSSAMMDYGCMTETAHSVEDLFYFIREAGPQLDFGRISDIILNVLDFMKDVLDKIENGDPLPQPDAGTLRSIYVYLEELKGGREEASQPESAIAEVAGLRTDSAGQRENANKVVWVRFDDDYEMESVRAFGLVKQLEQIVTVTETSPGDLQDFEAATQFIRKNGVEIFIRSDLENAEIEKFVRDNTVYLKDCRVDSLYIRQDASQTDRSSELKTGEASRSANKPSTRQSYISVNVNKLDKLMDVVGELVISELMVIKNPEIVGLKLKSFEKAVNRLKKMTDELQDIVMSIRMVPIGATFYSMQRIVRDMSKKLGKEVELVISGEETEVDKNIIESISDPLVHLIRNSIDHGIEDPATRQKLGKPAEGHVFLEARNDGGDVWITVRDDGVGLNREAILKKAQDNGLLTKPQEEYTDADVWKFILSPGFSTKKDISEYSGRGVGMDVVLRNIEKAGGVLQIESQAGRGTAFNIRFPLTLAIIDGMGIAVGKAHYTIPITSVKEAFKPRISDIISDAEGHEAILLRGECIEIIRLHKEFRQNTEITGLEDGILVICQSEQQTFAIFADKLLGQHQAVVKPVPEYMGKIQGISGCSILGDGRISLILDMAGLLERNGGRRQWIKNE